MLKAPKGYISPEKEDNKSADNYSAALPDSTVRVIPLVFHIMHTYGQENISKESVESQLKTLNETFRLGNADISKVNARYRSLASDCKIEFRLANLDPYGDCTDGIDRIYTTQTDNAGESIKQISQWDNTKYLNIWVVKSIQSPQGSMMIGYAQYPWESVASAKTDGIVIRADKVGKNMRYLTHEIGHYFGLYHTFEDGCGTDCKTTGDHVCDTPPEYEAHTGCDTTTNSCSNDNPDLPDMIENFMDYSECIRLFTAGQKNRMDYFISKYRSNLFSANNLSATGVNGTSGGCVPVADFYASFTQSCANNVISFFDNSYNAKVTSYKWTFPGGYPDTDSTATPNIIYKNTGSYSVKLEVSNSKGSSDITRIGYIRILPVKSGWKAPVIEDFENIDLQKSAWSFSVDNNNFSWLINNSNGFSGTRSIYINHGYTDENEYTFTMPAINLSNISKPKLKFYTAYRLVDTSTHGTLKVMASTDCGASFTTLLSKSGVALSTTDDGSRDFSPELKDWRVNIVDLGSLKNPETCIFKFSFKPHNGSDFYIDDIQLGSVYTGINNPVKQAENILIMPNPASNVFTLNISSQKAESASLNIFDMTGKRIFSSIIPLEEGENSFIYSKETTGISAAGVYYIRMNGTSSKLIITE